MRIVGVPAVQLAGMDQAIQVRDLEMEADWREVLQNYPTLLSGGAALAEKDGTVYLVSVGSAPVGNRAEIVARADAQRATLKFANGFTTRSTDESREEFVIIERNRQEKVLRDTEEALRRIRQKASGVVPGLVSIGVRRTDFHRFSGETGEVNLPIGSRFFFLVCAAGSVLRRGRESTITQGVS